MTFKSIQPLTQRTWIICVGLTLVSLLVFCETTRFQFTLDDQHHILRNPVVVGSQHSSTALSQATWPGNLYRPLFLLSLAFNNMDEPLDPQAYHVANVALYALVVIILFLLLRHLCPPKVAALAALVFAVHPIHVEAVANISNRSEMLAHLFGLLGTYFIIAPHSNQARTKAKPWNLAALFLFFFCALLSKESAFCYFALLPICLVHQLGFHSGVKRSVTPLVVMAAAGLLYSMLRVQALGGMLGTTNSFKPSLLDNPLISVSTLERIPIALGLLGKYAAMSFIPWPLSSDYSFAKITGSFDANLLLYSIGALALIVLLATGVSKDKRYWLWPAWFFVSFLVTSNLILLTGTAFAERLAFLGSAASSVLIAMAILGLKSGALRVASASLIVLLFAGYSFSYSLNWYDNHTLAKYEISHSAQSARSQYNYGTSLYIQSYAKQSEEYFERALEIYPDYAEAAYALAQATMRRWDKAQAEKWYLRAIELSPNHYGAILGLYGIAAGQKRTAEAALYRQRLEALDPNNPRLTRLDQALAIAATK